jgi:uncharacterized protein YrrD
MMTWPYYTAARTPVTHESVPLGQVEDLVLGPTDHRVTHILVKHRHLRGAKDITIPIGAVTGIDAEGVHVSLSKDDIGALPEVGLIAPA